jgi:homoserine dehydrogenase
MSQAPLNVALIGLGNVGTGVARILLQHAQRVTRRAGRPIVLRRAVVRDLSRPRDIALPRGVLTDELESVIRDPEIHVAVELMGGLHPAREVVLALLEAGKDVVTANKALLCQYGTELFARARELGRTMAFEAAVAGGIPIIAAVGQAMSANQITGMQAILNGTSNYILSEMLLRQQSYAAALRQAQELGYAEADPALDVNGTDAAQKLCLLAQLAFGASVAVTQFHVSGIDRLEQADIKYATELGYTIKLLASARLMHERLQMSVRPTLIRKDQPLAQIHGPFNAILLEGDVVGTVWYSGRGAGQMPTASAVTADIIDLAIGRAQLTFPRLDLWGATAAPSLLPDDAVTSRFYLRLLVEDRPHVMADLTHILGQHRISLASVIQPEAPEVEAEGPTPLVPLIIMTHRTTAGQLAAAERELARVPSVRAPLMTLAVAD